MRFASEYFIYRKGDGFFLKISKIKKAVLFLHILRYDFRKDENFV